MRTARDRLRAIVKPPTVPGTRRAWLDITVLEKEKIDRRIVRELDRYADGRMPKPKNLCRLAEKIVGS